MNIDTSIQYSADPYTTNYGAARVRALLAERYGDRYLKYRDDWARTESFWVPDFPLNLVFDLIDKCNLACPQCLRAPDLIRDFEGYIGTRKAVAYEDVVRMLDEGAANGLPSVNIGGSGEPTLHPDIVRICRAVMDRGVVEFRVISNGLKLTENIAGPLIEMQMHMLSVSIDAFSPETFEKTRGKARRYAECVENVRKFAELKRRMRADWPLLRVSFVEQACNRNETKAFVEYWSRFADMIDVQVYHDFRATAFNRDFDCSEPFRRLNVWAYGRMGPCCGFPGIVYDVGDWKRQTLREIWDGEPMQRMRRMMVAKGWQKPCLQCQGTRTTS